MIDDEIIKNALTMLLPLLKAILPWFVIGLIIKKGLKRKEG